MPKSKTLSLVIPAYNEERYLAACLDAVAAQTVMPDEVIVVDNNSTDRTAEIAGSYPFVKLLHEKRQGLRFSRNTGLDAAGGDILGRIDADTRLTSSWCREAKALFGQSSSEVAATGPCYYHDMPIRKTGLALDKTCRRLAFWMGEPMLYGSNMLLTRTLWHQIRTEICMEGEFFEDCDMTIHAQRRGHRIYFDEQLVVGVSSRRLDDSPLVFYRNMKQYDYTFGRHGVRNDAAQGAKYMYLAGYAPLKLIRRAYDADAGTMSLLRLFAPRSPARPNANI